MANQIEKVNTIAITSIEKINLLDDDAIEKLNLLEFTGVVDPTWSSGGNLYSARHFGALGGMAGTQLAALYAGGYGTAYAADAGEYNGTAWTQVSVGSLAAAKAGFAMGGTQGSALVAGGQTASADGTDTTETYDGSTWSSGAVINQDTGAVSGAGESATAFTFVGGDHY